MVKEHLNNLNTFLPYGSLKNQELLNNLSESELILMDEQLYFLRTNTNFSLIGEKMYEFLKVISELEALYNNEIKNFAMKIPSLKG